MDSEGRSVKFLNRGGLRNFPGGKIQGGVGNFCNSLAVWLNLVLCGLRPCFKNLYYIFIEGS
jgi:hypothetical protein